MAVLLIGAGFGARKLGKKFEWAKQAQVSKPRPTFLTFESEKTPDATRPDGEALLGRATAALERARALLEEQQQKTPARPQTLEFARTSFDEEESGSVISNQRTSARSMDDEDDAAHSRAREHSAHWSLQSSAPDWFGKGAPSVDEGDTTSSQGSSPNVGEPASSTGGSAGSSSGTLWAEFLPEMQRQQVTSRQQNQELQYAEPSLATFEYISQAAEDALRAKHATLPPLQSVIELTSAAQMPQRGELTADAAPSVAGRAMEDGAGVLPDGTRYERVSGEETGPDGYWYRWTRLRGVSSGGKVEWEERWWEASDWAGMKEMGAEKCGCAADGSAWRETWREAIAFDEATGEPLVERSAHKWAHDAKGDEWEEKWGEHYRARGHTNKYADKWARDGVNVWHEKWGEDYDGHGGCNKWTDKWAERKLEDGRLEQWGDKWDEKFKDGSGNKTGETWSVGAEGDRYSRWWGENHFGNGWVQKYGNSTTGEHWDASEQMDTYYNPIPHFDYRLALLHSPTLRSVPLMPRGGDELGDGLDTL